MGVLGLIEPLDPLDLDAKKVRAFYEPMVDDVNTVTGRMAAK